MTSFDALVAEATNKGEELKRKATTRERGPNLRAIFQAAPAGATAAELARFVLARQGFEAPGLDALTDGELITILRVGRRALEWVTRRDDTTAKGDEQVADEEGAR